MFLLVKVVFDFDICRENEIWRIWNICVWIFELDDFRGVGFSFINLLVCVYEFFRDLEYKFICKL